MSIMARSRGIWGTLGRRWKAVPAKVQFGAVVLGAFIVLGIVGPYVAPYDPSVTTVKGSVLLEGPSLAHLLGTTSTGQDVLSQLLIGVRSTLEIGGAVGAIATIIAVAFGIASGFLGGVWDEVLSLITNVFLVLPGLPLLVVLLSYQSARGQLPTIAVLSVLGWPWGARVIRSQTLSLANRNCIEASRETGERTWRILFVEILPNEVGLIAANFVGTVLYAIGTSVALAFLGLADISSWSIGTILYWAQNQDALQLGAWWWYAPAGLTVALIGMGLVLLNFGLDELGNPRLRDAARRRGRGPGWRPADPTPVLGRRPRRGYAAGWDVAASPESGDLRAGSITAGLRGLGQAGEKR
jgi:peptide/nickel transport system permease protein